MDRLLIQQPCFVLVAFGHFCSGGTAVSCHRLQSCPVTDLTRVLSNFFHLPFSFLFFFFSFSICLFPLYLFVLSFDTISLPMASLSLSLSTTIKKYFCFLDINFMNIFHNCPKKRLREMFNLCDLYSSCIFERFGCHYIRFLSVTKSLFQSHHT